MLVANAVAGRQMPKSAIGFVQCVYTRQLDLQIQSTSLKGKMNTTLMQDPGYSKEPLFLQCNIRMFARHCAAYLSAHVDDNRFMEDFILSQKMVGYLVQTTKDPTDYIFRKIALELQRSEDDICFFVLCYSALRACYEAICLGKLK